MASLGDSEAQPPVFRPNSRLAKIEQPWPDQCSRALSIYTQHLLTPGRETLMHKTLAGSLVATTIAVTLLFATTDDASAQRGWWPGFAIGAITGAVVAGAAIVALAALLATWSTQAMRAAGLRARVLLDVPTSLRWCRPHRRLYRPAGTSLPRLCRTSVNRKCAPTDARQIQQPADVGGDAPGLASGSLCLLISRRVRARWFRLLRTASRSWIGAARLPQEKV